MFTCSHRNCLVFMVFFFFLMFPFPKMIASSKSQIFRNVVQQSRFQLMHLALHAVITAIVLLGTNSRFWLSTCGYFQRCRDLTSNLPFAFVQLSLVFSC